MDGFSSDSTLDIIKEQSPDSKFTLEKDKGLYDALNKSIQLATGDVIGILHADDYYADETVLARAANIFNKDATFGFSENVGNLQLGESGPFYLNLLALGYFARKL